jgi:hypothetical protein
MANVAAQEGKYIYCIIEANAARSFGPLGIGGRGDELFSVCLDGIGAVVSNSPLRSGQPEKAIRRLQKNLSLHPDIDTRVSPLDLKLLRKLSDKKGVEYCFNIADSGAFILCAKRPFFGYFSTGFQKTNLDSITQCFGRPQHSAAMIFYKNFATLL